MIDLLNRITPIMSLFQSSSPSAVRSAIVSVVLDSLNRSICLSKLGYVQLIASIHIIFELIERFPDYSDSTSTIIAIVLPIYIRASTLHIEPSIIKGCAGKSMLQKLFTHNLLTQASARTCIAPQIASRIRFFNATITMAIPSIISLSRLTRHTNNNQLSKTLAHKIEAYYRHTNNHIKVA